MQNTNYYSCAVSNTDMYSSVAPPSMVEVVVNTGFERVYSPETQLRQVEVPTNHNIVSTGHLRSYLSMVRQLLVVTDHTASQH